MKPIIKAFDCTDHDPIEDWSPEASATVDYHLCLHIGPEEQKGADLFYVRIISGPEFQASAESDRTLYLTQYSWAEVKARAEAIVMEAECGNWDDTVKKLRDSFAWEFENYHEK